MNNTSVDKYKFYLMQQLVDEHHISELEAQTIIAKSTINRMLKTFPDFIMHYSIEDNAEEIWNEYMGIPMEM